MIDAELAKLLEVCGACERIARTPSFVPFAPLQGNASCSFCLPSHGESWRVRMVDDSDDNDLSLLHVGLEIVAEHVEDPFGEDEDDLDLEGLCQTIERSTKEIFHST